MTVNCKDIIDVIGQDAAASFFYAIQGSGKDHFYFAQKLQNKILPGLNASDSNLLMQNFINEQLIHVDKSIIKHQRILYDKYRLSLPVCAIAARHNLGKEMTYRIIATKPIIRSVFALIDAEQNLQQAA